VKNRPLIIDAENFKDDKAMWDNVFPFGHKGLSKGLHKRSEMVEVQWALQCPPYCILFYSILFYSILRPL
jgi:hypothetical protein